MQHKKAGVTGSHCLFAHSLAVSQMQRSMSALVALCLVAGASALSGAESVTPTQKVIALLNGMVEKGKGEKHSEEVAFADFSTFCDDNIVQKKRDVAQESERIETLKAEVQKDQADATHYGKRINFDDQDIDGASGSISAAQKVRAKEETDYRTTHKDYSESIDALDRAIAVLKKQTHSRTQASFAQFTELQSLSLIPPEAKKKIDLFLMQSDGDDDSLSISAPEANAYEFQSSGVIEMLEKLLDKFIEEKTTLEKNEANRKHAHEMLLQDKQAQIQLDEKDKTESSAAKGTALHSKASDYSSELETLKLKLSDDSTLEELEATCAQKKTEFESRQQLRSDEIVALTEAVEIMSSGQVSGHATTYLPSMMQTKGTALGQLRSVKGSPAQERVVQYLQEQAGRLNSRVLSALAVRAADDPFTKVKKMLKDLVVRLME